jgi:hypothetical protein
MPITTPAAGVFHAELLNEGGTAIDMHDSDGVEFVFTGVIEGSYTMRVCRYDVSGAVMGTAIEQAFTVSADNVMVDLPATMTINVTAE